eukprot:TRINITY_DN21447_c0_g1_i1.p1 TRINITY_DN21447_c0_g1~~TRINITY_DN21447_c0_g1_i1.p1  ORF type:complete len:209 (+),score=37.50 TRINITY_DN21447_c0_g1_i1:166-792(+)
MEEQSENKFRFPLEIGINRVGFGLGVGCGFGIGVGKPFNFSGVPVAGQIMGGLQQGASMIRFGDVRGLIQKTGADVGIGCGAGLGYGWGAAGMFVSTDAMEILQTNIQKVKNYVQKKQVAQTFVGGNAANNQQLTQQNFQRSDSKGQFTGNNERGRDVSVLLQSLVESQQKQLQMLQQQLDYKLQINELKHLSTESKKSNSDLLSSGE